MLWEGLSQLGFFLQVTVIHSANAEFCSRSGDSGMKAYLCWEGSQCGKLRWSRNWSLGAASRVCEPSPSTAQVKVSCNSQPLTVTWARSSASEVSSPWAPGPSAEWPCFPSVPCALPRPRLVGLVAVLVLDSQSSLSSAMSSELPSLWVLASSLPLAAFTPHSEFFFFWIAPSILCHFRHFWAISGSYLGNYLIATAVYTLGTQ